ncbi:MAG: twin-arginine translocase TatA/TatE family subunit [Gammaproteobacteria bacterium]|nr:MAG: twin-arginine translocase TatA/TatE family subunit [Gammaproteobacteria bacterium]
MGPSWIQILVLLLIVVIIFGTKRLRSLGSDLGAAIKGFKKALNEDEGEDKNPSSVSGRVIDTDAKSVDKTTDQKD